MKLSHKHIVIILLLFLITIKIYHEKTRLEDIELEEKSLPMVYPDAVSFSEKKGAPPHYEAYVLNERGEKELDGLCFLSTDFAPDVRGYAGRIKILIGMSKSGKVNGIKILSHNETPSYTSALQEAVFTDQFKKLDYRSEFRLGGELDGITRATITSHAVLLAVEKSVKLAANKFFGLEVKQKESFRWKEIFGNYNLYVISLFFILAIYFYLHSVPYVRYFILAGAILYFGFLELNFISIIGLINIFTGRVPDIVTGLSWYLLFVWTFTTAMFFGRIYCNWICPFGAIQEFLGKISRFHVKINGEDEEKARLIKYCLFIITVGAVFFTGNVGFTNYEPFNTIFRLEGSVFAFVFLAFLLVSSLFIPRFWCRYLCGVGAFLSMMKREILFLLIVGSLFFLKGGDAEMIRKPAVAGQFYPGTKEELIKMIDEFLTNANPPKLEGKLIGLISPHAGYVYSGQVAAYSYKLLQNAKYDVVLIIGGSHIMPFNYGAVYYRKDDENYFRTPVGDVKVNKAIAEELLKNRGTFRADNEPHIYEHSIEVQIPFLQRVLKPGFEIVPILFGTHSYEILESAAGSIVDAIKGMDVLLIASTDLSHYYSYRKSQEMDKIAVDAIATLNPLVLVEQVNNGRCELCGLSAVLVEMIVAKKMGANNVQVLNIANSGDVAIGDKDKVVGYSAIAITRK